MKPKVDPAAMERLTAAVATVKAELVELAAGQDCYFLRESFINPGGPPVVLLPPGVDPEFSQEELYELGGDNIDEYAKVYYLRSGRWLGLTDEYMFARCFLPDGRLPWE